MKKLVSLLLLIPVIFASCNKSSEGPSSSENSTPVHYTWQTFSMGVDLSYVNELQDYGVAYQDSGKVMDPFVILKNHGANTVRVRLWYNPQWVAALTGGKMYSDLADVEKTIRRAKDLGMAVNLDIHYSDTWADPGKQDPPAVWAGLPLSTLKDSVYNYTRYVLNYLKAKSLTPEMVQIGNETNSGMLWPVGKVQGTDWTAFGTLLNEGIRAVRDFSATSDIKPRIILHVAQFQNAVYYAQHVINDGKVTDFDILGISHYSKWSTMNGMYDIAQVIRNVASTSHKEVMIVETAYPWTDGNADSYPNIFNSNDALTGYPLTEEGQLKYLKALTQAVISGGGKGIMYWEPAWITSAMPDPWGTGSAWDNCTLFDFSGHVLTGSDYMTAPYNF